MDKIRITKSFDFEAAHALDGYHGKCKDIHGHSYHLKVTVIGRIDALAEEAADAMVMDFSDLKQVVKKNIVDKLDHMLIVKRDGRFSDLYNRNERILYVDYQPTCENMLMDIVHTLQELLSKSVALHSVFLQETPRSYAEWYADDNH